MPKQALALRARFHSQNALCSAQLGVQPRGESDKETDTAGELTISSDCDPSGHISPPPGSLWSHTNNCAGAIKGWPGVPVGEEGTGWPQ